MCLYRPRGTLSGRCREIRFPNRYLRTVLWGKITHAQSANSLLGNFSLRRVSQRSAT